MVNFAVQFEENDKTFDLVFNEGASAFGVVFTERYPHLGVEFDDVVIVADTTNIPRYEGNYNVTPTIERNTLDTHNKLMESNLVVDKIPYYEVSNTSGGITASIAT